MLVGQRVYTVGPGEAEKPVEALAEPAAVSPPLATVVATPTWGEAVANRLQELCGFLFSVGAVLILSRFTLAAAAANSAPFTAWVNQLTEPLLKPFHGLLTSPPFNGRGILELDDLVAILAYAVGTALVCHLLGLLLRPMWPVRRIEN